MLGGGVGSERFGGSVGNGIVGGGAGGGKPKLAMLRRGAMTFCCSGCSWSSGALSWGFEVLLLLDTNEGVDAMARTGGREAERRNGAGPVRVCTDIGLRDCNGWPFASSMFGCDVGPGFELGDDLTGAVTDRLTLNRGGAGPGGDASEDRRRGLALD
jgi:hypothetical protein